MQSQMPEWADPHRLARQDKSFCGRKPIGQFQRFKACLTSESGEVAYQLRFHRDEQGRTLLSGDLRASPQLECQRCLEPMTWELSLSLALVLVRTEVEAERLETTLDVVVAEEGESIHLLDLLEDEMILALPTVAKHADSNCAGLLAAELPESKDSGAEEKVNPFAALAAWRDK